MSCCSAVGPKELQPWLVALTAVVIFLFIVFVLLLINRLWQIRRHRWASVTGHLPWPGGAGPGAAGSCRARGWPHGAVGGAERPRARLSLSLPRRKRSRHQEVQGSGRLERADRATPAAEDSDERSGEESSKVTAF
ncbi:small integral membrane protein 24 [Pogoniulus pusillus]|uniref:small integral membrane protein 24 n=1 Tax=Pogoniulus pusillus TaxID=488313 RepID=UPI0030B943BA